MTFNWLFLEISDFFLTQHLLTAPTDSIIKLYFLHMQLLGQVRERITVWFNTVSRDLIHNVLLFIPKSGSFPDPKQTNRNHRWDSHAACSHSQRVTQRPGQRPSASTFDTVVIPLASVYGVRKVCASLGVRNYFFVYLQHQKRDILCSFTEIALQLMTLYWTRLYHFYFI